jgi:hypothetical protein
LLRVQHSLPSGSVGLPIILWKLSRMFFLSCFPRIPSHYSVSSLILYEGKKYSWPCVSLIKHCTMQMCGVIDVRIHAFLTSALLGGGMLALHPEKDPPLIIG